MASSFFNFGFNLCPFSQFENVRFPEWDRVSRFEDKLSRMMGVLPVLGMAYVETPITFVHFQRITSLAPSVLFKQHPKTSG